ncbi:MAG: NAD(P)-binding domain-containing protein, partial [Elusimicrobiota bacterium]
MKIAIVGLGRMGMNMARRLIQGRHEIVVFNRSLEKVELMAKEGAVPAKSLKEVIALLPKPRVVWLMLPA